MSKKKPDPPTGSDMDPDECDTPAPRVFSTNGMELPEEEPTGQHAGHQEGARWSKYLPQYVGVAQGMCRLGATKEQLADAFGVSQRTVDYWATQHAEFREAMRIGRKVPNQMVERSLFERAMGYWVEETKLFMPAGASAPVAVPIRTHIPADPKCIALFLSNRMPEKWRERSEALSGTVNVVVKHYEIPNGEKREPLDAITLESVPTPGIAIR